MFVIFVCDKKLILLQFDYLLREDKTIAKFVDGTILGQSVVQYPLPMSYNT